jgi:nucleoside-diphosphate-sugar epimerase
MSQIFPQSLASNCCEGIHMQSTVMILGARGRFGQACARAFADAGWRVLAQCRAGAVVPAALQGDKRIQWLSVDLSQHEALEQAAQGAEVVVHALNPTAYTNAAWSRDSLPMLESSIALTRKLNATLMLPGNIYNFGKSMPALLREDTPQAAQTVKGHIRVGMEAHLRRSGVRSVVIRAGDFFGSGSGTWFDQAIVKKVQQGTFTYPGSSAVPTAWAYLPDLARTFVQVAQRRADLSHAEVLHFAGHTLTGQQWLDAITPLAQAQGWVKPDQPLRWAQLPWGVMRLGAWLVPTWKSFLEMQYLWDTPHALDNHKLVALIGAEPHTPLGDAVQSALTDLGMVTAAQEVSHAAA